MPSSKFNKRPVPRRRPAICIAPPGSCLPPFDTRTPPDLYGWVNWRDLDPVSPMDAKSMMTTVPRSPTGLYKAIVVIGSATIGANIQDNWPAPTVDVEIFYQDAFWGYQSWFFPTLSMPVDRPFNTGTLTAIFVPGTDFRITWFTA